ncbi:MAG: FtsX-like permease family protein [Opitutaceae bacterium]|jgi:putative ABC transport system permease protein
MSTLFLLVRRSLRQHALSTLVTALSIALAGGLLMAVWAVKTQARAVFTQTDTGFDAVLGARGSKLQLVLNAVFHLEASPGNITAADYDQIRANPAVRRAVPLALGDNLKGYRIVGTIPEFFTEGEYAPGRHFKLAQGKWFALMAREAVVGDFAARQLGLKVGDTFHPFHGLSYNPSEQHAETYVVAGVLAPSNTPVDKVVWIPVEGVQTMTGHDPKMSDELSAVLVKLTSPMVGFQLDRIYNREGSRLTFAYPIGAIVADLFGKISWFDQVLSLVAWLVAVVSAAGVLVAIYNSMSARRKDLAILRALGARRVLLFASVVTEAAMIGALGMVLALAVYAGIFYGVAAAIRAQTGVALEPWAWTPVFVWAPLGMVVLCALSGLLPAAKAYRTDVARHLAPLS